MKTVLTTAEVAERKRFQFWQDAVCDTFVELDCQARRGAGVFRRDHDRSVRRLAFLQRAGGRADRQAHAHPHQPRSRRGHAHQRAGAAASASVAQDGREARLEPGDFACYDSTRPYTLNFDAGFEQLVLHMPREAMVRRIGRTELWTARRIEAASPVGSLVLPFVQPHRVDRVGSRSGDGEPAFRNLSFAGDGGARRAVGRHRRRRHVGANRADSFAPRRSSKAICTITRSTPRKSPSLSAFRRATSRICFTPKARR